jgi:hypothetical protein
MPFELDTYHRNLSESELIADMQRVASELGKETITRAEQNEFGSIHSATVVRRFSSWTDALAKAKLANPRVDLDISKEELFQNLEEVWTKLGRQPSMEETHLPLSKYHGATYKRRFGGWRKALEAFVAYINDEERNPSAEGEEQITEPRLFPKGPRKINWRLRFIVMRRDNFKCRACGRSPATDPTVILHVDHVEAWSRDGKTVLENLQTLCSICNIGKSNLEFQEVR